MPSSLVPTGQEVLPAGVELAFPGRPVDAALSPDGRTLAVLKSVSLQLLDVRSKGGQVLPAPLPDSPFSSTQVSAAASVDVQPAPGYKLSLWDRDSNGFDATDPNAQPDLTA